MTQSASWPLCASLPNWNGVQATAFSEAGFYLRHNSNKTAPFHLATVPKFPNELVQYAQYIACLLAELKGPSTSQQIAKSLPEKCL